MKKKRGAFFTVLLVLALLAAAGLVWLLAPGANPETPPVVLPPAPTASGAPSGVADDPAGEEIAVTPATVQAAIATLARPGSYARTLYTELFWSGGGRADELDVWVRGENTRIVIRGGDEEKNILLRADGTWLWYTGADGAYRGPARTGDSDAWQTLLRYEDILSADPDDITDAGYTDFGGEHCIYARWRAGELGYESLCYVSVDTGLLMGLQTYDGEILIYSMHSSEPDISTPDDDLFEPPSEEQ